MSAHAPRATVTGRADPALEGESRTDLVLHRLQAAANNCHNIGVRLAQLQGVIDKMAPIGKDEGRAPGIPQAKPPLLLRLEGIIGDMDSSTAFAHATLDELFAVLGAKG